MKSQSVVLTVILLSVIAIVALSLLYLGSPATVRDREQDERRVSHLQKIKWEVIAYRSDHGRLPPDLDALRLGNRWREIPVDPASGSAYGYRPAGDRFELCAIFAQEHRASDEWAHGTGRFCFETVLGED